MDKQKIEKLAGLADIVKNFVPRDVESTKDFMQEIADVFQTTMDPEAVKLTGDQLRQRAIQKEYRKIKLSIAPIPEMLEMDYEFKVSDKAFIDAIIELLKADGLDVQKNTIQEKYIKIKW
jgi:hypothetical protein